MFIVRKFVTEVIRRLGFYKTMEELVELAPFETLSERVIVIRGQNPGKMTLQGTNTYLVGTGPERILIDAGEGVPKYGDYLKPILQSLNVTITDIILTHRHHDHINGIPQVLSLQSRDPALVNLWKKMTPRDDESCEFKFKDIPDNHVFSTQGATLRTLYTPGHCDDHVVLFLEEENVLFSGDSVLGQGTTVFESLGEYMRSLQRTLDTFPSTSQIYPAHGPVLKEGPAVIQKYIQHRQDREAQILDAVNSLSASQKPVTSLDIVKVVYKGYPEAVWPYAEHG
ncbi:Beta-lactamase-like protein 2 [Dinochytrium kinnereticum]|nr:Beta-lactamase-like protein 2 [Dinochytrium kinnereticum]